MGWGDQGRQHQTRVSPSQSMTIHSRRRQPRPSVDALPLLPQKLT
jgi:hypothetical protein